ncbi:sensor histidine kinase [Dermatobacter hominis]|uniref:sensor histidine kinase n=1 Tax=Dermatobacter hominis TaxID=2884263 RepID=UPI001D0F4FD2|nr:histidine kinase [Dermatobacter hominis]UDY35677.1 histidine kinase [Dermatobacter hominis]
MLAVVAVALAVVAATRLDVEGRVAAGVIGAWAALGLWTALRRPAEPVGLLAVAASMVGAATLLALSDDGSDVAEVVVALSQAIGPALLFQLASSLPTGRLARRPRHRTAVIVAWASAAVVAVVGVAARPDPPVALIVAWLAVLGVAALVLFVTTCRRAGPRDRARLQWDGWGVLVAATVALAAWALDALTGWPATPSLVAAVATVAVPVGFLAATSEPALARVDRVLVHTIVTIGLVALVVCVYVVVVLGLQGTPSDEARSVLGLSLVAAAIAAALSFPARRRLEEFANQRVYGERSAPDEALRTFATRMSRSVPMDELLRQLAESLRKSMGVARAEVWTGTSGHLERQVSVPDAGAAEVTLEGEELAVASRTHVAGNGWLAVWIPALLAGRGDRVLRVAPVAHLGELLGLLVVERTQEDTAFDEEDDRVLADLARQVGLALHNVRLDSALQDSLEQLQLRNEQLVASRARIVSAADESRRAIERNLHDGAQQHLVAMAVKVGLVRQVMAKDPDAASAMLEELREDVQVTVGELRELAHGIYPPLLRDRGLPEALRTAANRAALPTDVVVAEDLGRFPTDLEAAVYFCCLEAMQNAGKHAGEGAEVTVTIVRADHELRFAVADDGVGFVVGDRPEGHGFVNMEDRLGAMGGRLEVESAPGRGTTVRGTIPID